MSTKFLFPNQFKTIGWFILIPTVILWIIFSITEPELDWLKTTVFAIIDDEVLGESKFFHLVEVNVTSTLFGVLFIIGAFFVGFSKEKSEDEFIAELRWSSLLWAVWANYILLLLAFLFVYGMAFLQVMLYNMFTILIIFIVRFNYILFRNSKTSPDEK